MFIVNDRVGNDTNIGRFTWRNASVVDYCITSPELLKLFFDFDILESSKLFYFSFRVISFPNSITIAIIIV
jgi:hypothetical protein